MEINMKNLRSMLTLIVITFLFIACASPDLTPTLAPQPTATVAIPTTVPVQLPTLCASPEIAFDHMPPYNSFDDLHGQVNCITSADYKVAIFIFVSGWWTKPLWDTPTIPIQSDGSWSADITTGGVDQQATRIAAFLVPDGFSPPLMRGEQELPAELFANAVTYTMVDREPVFRTIEFSGYTWRVKESSSPAGPGPNYFSDKEEDVWVDAEGQLHLKIVQRDGRWYSTEVISTVSLGYGKYVFTTSSPVDKLNQNAVLGLFTWDDTAPQYNYREIDIEFSRWGEDNGQNSQYVVQPWDHAGNRYRFDSLLEGEYSTHSFEWSPTSIEFSSSDSGAEFQTWSYTGPDIPPAGDENARINLWLLNGMPPSDGQEVEVIIKSFEFIPLTK
jgi:hypothetical protein